METFLDFLAYPVFQLSDQVITAGQLLMVPTVLLVGYYLIQASNRKLMTRLRKRQFDPDLLLLIQRLYLAVMLVLLALTGLSLLNVPLTAFAFVSGALAIGVGFGAQNIVSNFISGWILMWERPIRIGDFLEIGDVKGTVETINTRSTLVRRVDGVHLLIPNSHLLENMVVNWTLIDRLARATVRVGVAYGSPTRKTEELITRVAAAHPDVLEDPAPKVIFEDFGDSALIFDLYFWINTFGEKDLRIIKSEIRHGIDEILTANAIVIAFPQRDVHVDGHLSITGTGLPHAPEAGS
ncbi:MAG: mechanosensitive ion channel domain-containing protein [Pseudohongiellaceae bacterium]